MKFERDEGSFEILLCVCSIRVFTKFSGDPYYESLAWFMITLKIVLIKYRFTSRITKYVTFYA